MLPPAQILLLRFITAQLGQVLEQKLRRRVRILPLRIHFLILQFLILVLRLQKSSDRWLMLREIRRRHFLFKLLLSTGVYIGLLFSVWFCEKSKRADFSSQ
jgi:uncharacterized membrane protein